MKVLIFWDVYWRIWRKALKKQIPLLKEEYKPDFVIVNSDNISSGRWPVEKHILEMLDNWVDLITCGDHVFDNFDKIKDYISSEDSKFIRAANFYRDDSLEGIWYKITEKNGKKILVISLIWETYMNIRVSNPFLKADEILNKFKNEKLDWIIVDFHKETSSEGYGLAFYLDSKVSFIFWTHTHVQTNDEIILKWGTGFISDVWMNASLYSVIWAEYSSVESRFINWFRKDRMKQCLDNNYLINWVCVNIWDNMKCEKIEKIRIRDVL